MHDQDKSGNRTSHPIPDELHDASVGHLRERTSHPLHDGEVALTGDAGGHHGSTVRVLPSGIRFVVAPDETVFEAAGRQGIVWPTVCGGVAECTKCFMTVLDGTDHLSSMGDSERDALQRMRPRENPKLLERLACCVRLTGDIEVHRRSVRRSICKE